MKSTLFTDFLSAQWSVGNFKQHITLCKNVVEKEPHLHNVLKEKDYLSDLPQAMLLIVIHSSLNNVIIPLKKEKLWDIFFKMTSLWLLEQAIV